MIGSIIGDMSGSIYEGPYKNPNRKNFILLPNNCYFTDDSILSVAVADVLLNKLDYAKTIRLYYSRYPYGGYGKAFKKWAKSENDPAYNSYGNGSAMRISPIVWAFETKEDILNEAKKSAECTHNHEEGIKGAQAIALAGFMARKGCSKAEIKLIIESEFKYDLVNIDRKFDSSCQGSVPNAIAAFLDSDNFVDCIKRAVFYGGDSDTVAAMAGTIAQPFYNNIPKSSIRIVFTKLPDDLARVIVEFTKKYIDKNFVRPAHIGRQAELYNLYRLIIKK